MGGICGKQNRYIPSAISTSESGESESSSSDSSSSNNEGSSNTSSSRSSRNTTGTSTATNTGTKTTTKTGAKTGTAMVSPNQAKAESYKTMSKYGFSSIDPKTKTVVKPSPVSYDHQYKNINQNKFNQNKINFPKSTIPKSSVPKSSMPSSPAYPPQPRSAVKSAISGSINSNKLVINVKDLDGKTGILVVPKGANTKTPKSSFDQVKSKQEDTSFGFSINEKFKWDQMGSFDTNLYRPMGGIINKTYYENKAEEIYVPGQQEMVKWEQTAITPQEQKYHYYYDVKKEFPVATNQFYAQPEFVKYGNQMTKVGILEETPKLLLLDYANPTQKQLFIKLPKVSEFYSTLANNQVQNKVIDYYEENIKKLVSDGIMPSQTVQTPTPYLQQYGQPGTPAQSMFMTKKMHKFMYPNSMAMVGGGQPMRPGRPTTADMFSYSSKYAKMCGPQPMVNTYMVPNATTMPFVPVVPETKMVKYYKYEQQQQQASAGLPTYGQMPNTNNYTQTDIPEMWAPKVGLADFTSEQHQQGAKYVTTVYPEETYQPVFATGGQQQQQHELKYQTYDQMYPNQQFKCNNSDPIFKQHQHQDAKLRPNSPQTSVNRQNTIEHIDNLRKEIRDIKDLIRSQNTNEILSKIEELMLNFKKMKNIYLNTIKELTKDDYFTSQIGRSESVLGQKINKIKTDYVDISSKIDVLSNEAMKMLNNYKSRKNANDVKSPANIKAQDVKQLNTQMERLMNAIQTLKYSYNSEILKTISKKSNEIK